MALLVSKKVKGVSLEGMHCVCVEPDELTGAWSANRLMNDSLRSWSDIAAAVARRMRSWRAAADADDATTMTTADDDDDDLYHGRGYDCGDDAAHRLWCSPNALSADLRDYGQRANAAGILAKEHCACCAGSQVSANCCHCCCSCWSCCSAARTGWDARPG